MRQTAQQPPRCKKVHNEKLRIPLYRVDGRLGRLFRLRVQRRAPHHPGARRNRAAEAATAATLEESARGAIWPAQKKSRWCCSNSAAPIARLRSNHFSTIFSAIQ